MSKQRLLLGSLGLIGAGGRKDEELQSRALKPLQVFSCKHLLKPEKGFFQPGSGSSTNHGEFV